MKTINEICRWTGIGGKHLWNHKFYLKEIVVGGGKTITASIVIYLLVSMGYGIFKIPADIKGFLNNYEFTVNEGVVGFENKLISPMQDAVASEWEK